MVWNIFLSNVQLFIWNYLEAHVAPEKYPILEKVFKEGKDQRPPQLLQTFLVQSTTDPTLWRIIGLWDSREALEEMRRLGTPKGILMFRETGAEPTLSTFDVIAYAASDQQS